MLLVPASFAAILHELRPVFSSASYLNFLVLVYGWLHALGGGRVSDAIRAAGAFAGKHYSTYYRFFSRAAWCQDELGLRLLAVIERVQELVEFELVIDDTLMRKSGKKIALAGMHHDPLLKSGGRAFCSYGHVFVVLSVHIRVPAISETGWALPILFRLYEPSKQGGRKDAPSDQRRTRGRRRRGAAGRTRVRKTDRLVTTAGVERCDDRPDDGPLPKEVRPTKLQLATELILLVAKRFPHLPIRVLADHLYNGAAVLRPVHAEVSNVHCVMRGRADAALYTLPPPRKPGQRGRPRVKGERLPNPTAWAVAHPEAFERVDVDIYGKRVPLLVASFEGMAYRSLPGRLLKYVIVRDPDGIYAEQYLFTTDLTMTAAEVVEAYARRWPLERAFQDCKQKLGLAESETQLPASVRRVAPFAMLLYSLVVFWYVTEGHGEAAVLQCHRDPWNPKEGRPSFSDMLAALRRLGWARALADPACDNAMRQKTLRDYLERVVAAA